MTTAPVSARAILAEQTERTRQSSKADIERSIQESELKIISLESQLRTLELQPRVLESQITALVELRDRERLCADSLRYIISPICTLPVELLADIFELTIDDKTHIEDAYRISQICSGWREVAHATPRLWTGPIRVDLSSRPRDGQGLYADGLEAWLAHSQPFPVPVSLWSSRASLDPRILDHVFKIAPRFRSLRCGNHFPLSLLSQLAECRLDSLEELKLGLADDCPNISESPVLTMVPRLHKLTMTIYSYEPYVLSPWAQLADLTLDSNSPDTILDILSQCTALTHASIRTSGWPKYVAAQPTRPPLTFSYLHTLSLDFGFPQHIMEFLGSLSTPVLEALHLNFVKMCDTMQSEISLAAFLMQSPNITRLEILCGPYALTSHELIVALEHTVHLTHLKLAYPHEHSLDNNLIDALSYKDNVAPLVPDLHNLVLDNIEEDGVSTDALKRLLFSRWRADGEITSLSGLPAVARWSRVELWGLYSEEYVSSMKTLQRQGLPLELHVENLEEI